MRARNIDKHGTRRAVATHDHRHPAGDQRREQIAKPVGVRDRDDAKIQIGIANSHRVANLIAIGQQLVTAKSNCPRRGRCAGGKL